MACPGKWKHGLLRSDSWFNFDPHPFEAYTQAHTPKPTPPNGRNPKPRAPARAALFSALRTRLRSDTVSQANRSGVGVGSNRFAAQADVGVEWSKTSMARLSCTCFGRGGGGGGGGGFGMLPWPDFLSLLGGIGMPGIGSGEGRGSCEGPKCQRLVGLRPAQRLPFIGRLVCNLLGIH